MCSQHKNIKECKYYSSYVTFLQEISQDDCENATRIFLNTGIMLSRIAFVVDALLAMLTI